MLAITVRSTAFEGGCASASTFDRCASASSTVADRSRSRLTFSTESKSSNRTLRMGVLREHKAFLAMRLQAKGAPDAPDAGWLGWRFRAKSACSNEGGGAFQSLGDDIFDALVVNLPRCPRSWFIKKTVHTMGQKQSPPKLGRPVAGAQNCPYLDHSALDCIAE